MVFVVAARGLGATPYQALSKGCAGFAKGLAEAAVMALTQGLHRCPRE